MKKYYPCKMPLTILIVLCFALCVILCGLAEMVFYSFPILMWTTLLIFGVGLIILPIIIFPLYFSLSHYEVSADGIKKQTGVIFRTEQIMRISSVQYVTTIIFPLSKYTGFNFLKLNALGGSIFLVYLSYKDLLEIEHFLNSEIRKQASRKS